MKLFKRKPVFYQNAGYTVCTEIGNRILITVTDLLRHGGEAVGIYQPDKDKKERFASYFVGKSQTARDYRWWATEVATRFTQDCFLNTTFCLLGLLMLLFSYEKKGDSRSVVVKILDLTYNVWYGVLAISVGWCQRNGHSYSGLQKGLQKVGFAMDIVSYAHYLPLPYHKLVTQHVKPVCYLIRLHRPLQYIWAIDNNNMNSSLLVTALKYMYYTTLLRIVWGYVSIFLVTLQEHVSSSQRATTPHPLRKPNQNHKKGKNYIRTDMLWSFYYMDTMFIPIGTLLKPPLSDDKRVFITLVMTAGALVLGAATTALSSVISIYMRPEENFRTRYRIIMRDLKGSEIPISLRNKVDTFYKMYWHKQRAVSATQLLPSFPPVLSKSVYMDIYFKATQKSGALRDLSYHFLSEVAMNMETVLYIPGDTIIKRNSHKNSIIYILYGDIEMLTAENDMSPMLRFTRGTCLTPWGACAGGGRAHVQIRAATFCAAHALGARGLWCAALRHGRGGQTRVMLAELRAHLDKVKRHYATRKSPTPRYKSSILEFKKNLMALKLARDENGELLLAGPDFLDIAGCYYMRNRQDAALTEDSDAICLRQTCPCILQPSSSLLTAWNWLVAVVTVVVCFTYPYYLIYKTTIPLNFQFFDMLVTILYMMDIYVYLSTGTNVEEGVPITFKQTSSMQARSPWFVLDVISVLPIFTFTFEGQFVGLNKILRFHKVIRAMHAWEEGCVYHSNVVRFFTNAFMLIFLLFVLYKHLPVWCRVIRAMHAWEEGCVYHSNVVRFFTNAFMLIFACYFLAALQQAYVCYGYNCCYVTNFTHAPFWTESPPEIEASEDDTDDDTLNDKLYFSLYWAISLFTFTSFMPPKVVPDKNSNQWMYAVVIIEMCIVLRICIEAVYSATIMVTTAFRENFDACVSDVRSFLIGHDVAPLLRQRFVDHLQLSWNTRKAYALSSKQSSVFYDLPPHVYQDILARQRSKYMLCIPFMKLLHKEDLKNVASNARQFYSAPSEILLNTGDISTEMYIIKQGFCEILNPDTKEVVSTLVAKSHFGVLECLLRFPAFYTVRATTHVQLFSISRKYLTQALEIPQIKDAINFAKEQEEYSRLQVRREPFVCYRAPARAPARQLFRLPRKHDRDSAFLQPFTKLGFFSILKNVFPRFTFRPDSELLTRYEICRAFCAFAGAFVFPCYMYMVLQFPWLYHVAVLLDLFAYSDIVFRTLVGYFDDNGILVYHPAKTAARYLSGAFLVDTFGCLPLESLVDSTSWYHEAAIKQVLMLNRLLQLYRLPGTLGVLTSRIERRDIIFVLQALPLFLTMINVLTSLLVISSGRIHNSADGGELPEWGYDEQEDPGGSWIDLFYGAFHFEATETPWHLHLSCYLWVVYEATTTGCDALAPTNLNILAVLSVAMVLGSLMTIYMSVRIISIRANVNKALAGYQAHMRDLVQFMQREKLDQTLQKEIVEHYQFNWLKTGGVDARHVLKLCDQITLRSDAILHLYGPAFAKCPILKDCDVSLLRVLGRAVRSIHFLEGTTIFQEDDVIDHLYFVYSGHLQLQTFNWTDGTTQVTNLDIGSMVGNLDDTRTARISSRLVASTDVHLLQMSSVAFHDIVRYCDFPVVYQLIAKYRANNEMFVDADADSRWVPASRRRLSDAAVERFRHRIHFTHAFLISVSIACVYTDLYNAGFQDNGRYVLTTLYLLDLCFVMKILLHLMLPQLVTLPSGHDLMVRQDPYFKSAEFKYDIASCVPIELASLLCPNRLLGLSLLRLNRTLRFKTVSTYLKRYQKRLSENLFLSTLVLMVWFTLYVHCCTCLWYFIGLMQENHDAWFYDQDDKSICHKSTYLCSLYVVMALFVQNGICDAKPGTEIEVFFVSVFLILSNMVVLVYVGEFSNILHYTSFRAFSYYSKFQELQEFLKNNRVSPKLMALLNKYSVLLWREARGEQMPAFLLSAPMCLKLKVMSHAYKEVAEQHPVFKHCESALIRQVVGYLRQHYYDENMYVVKQNEITDSMYLVHTGKVEEIRETADGEETEGQKRKIYTPGEYFGVEQGFLRNKRFRYSYRTTVKSQILTLRLDDWEYLLKHFPYSKDLIDNYQWTNQDDDDHDVQGPKSDGAPPPSTVRRLDPNATLGTPHGSEITLQVSSQGPSDGSPRGPQDGRPRRPSGLQSDESAGLSKMVPLIDLKQSNLKSAKSVTKRLSKKHKAKQTTSPAVGEKTPSTVQNTEDDQLKTVFSKESSLSRNQKSVVWATKKKTKISLASNEYILEESIIDKSSTTELFERIRKAALAVDKAAAKRRADDNDNASKPSLAREDSDVVAVSIPHLSVEEYLAYKFKMRESYAITSQPSKSQLETRTDDYISRSSILESQVQFLDEADDRPGREDYRHSQLAETPSSARINIPPSLSFSTVNLDKPLVDRSESLASTSRALDSVRPVEREKSAVPKLQQSPTDMIPLDTLQSGQDVSQVPTSSKQITLGESPGSGKNEESSDVYETTIVDFDSDVAERVKSRQSKTQVSVGPTLSKSPVIKESSQAEQPDKEAGVLSANVVPEIQLIDYDSDVADHMSHRPGLTVQPATELLAILPAPSLSEFPSSPATFELPVPPLQPEPESTQPAISDPEAREQPTQLIHAYIRSFIESFYDALVMPDPSVRIQTDARSVLPEPQSPLPLDSVESDEYIPSIHLFEENENRAFIMASREDQVTGLATLPTELPVPFEPATPSSQLALPALPAPPPKGTPSEQPADLTGSIPRETADEDSHQKLESKMMKDTREDAQLALLHGGPPKETVSEQPADFTGSIPTETPDEDSHQKSESEMVKDTPEGVESPPLLHVGLSKETVSEHPADFTGLIPRETPNEDSHQKSEPEMMKNTREVAQLAPLHEGPSKETVSEQPADLTGLIPREMPDKDSHQKSDSEMMKDTREDTQLPLLHVGLSKETVSEQPANFTGLIPRETPNEDSHQKLESEMMKNTREVAQLAPLHEGPSKKTVFDQSSEGSLGVGSELSRLTPKGTQPPSEDPDNKPESEETRNLSDTPKTSRSLDEENDQGRSDKNTPDENKTNDDKNSNTEEDNTNKGRENKDK